MTPEQLLHQSQIAMIQHSANADAAIAEARWLDAQTSLRFLRWEISNAEQAITMIQAYPDNQP